MTEGQEERLRQIAVGAEMMAALGQDRLRAAIEALLDGDFDGAADRTGEALAKLQLLQQAQLALGRMAAPGTTIVRADELEAGDILHGWGTVNAPIEPFGGGQHAPGVLVKWTDLREQDQEKSFAADAELVITREPVE